ncbi:MAG: GNAT family N-acetyltransferase [Myxococcales bacterium]|nr:GNAT family N-acetyltransferase [Myxococcales bacterium]
MWSSPPPEVLETARLRLHRVSARDIDALHAHLANPQVSRYLDFQRPMARVHTARIVQWLQAQYAAATGVRWVLCDGSAGVVLGTIGFHHIAEAGEPPRLQAEIGYDLTPSRWGQGLMAEALAASLKVGEGQLGLQRVEALVAPGNTRSQRVLERAGFACLGPVTRFAEGLGRHWEQVRYVRDAV